MINELKDTIQNELITKDFCDVNNQPNRVINYLEFKDLGFVLMPRLNQCKMQDELLQSVEILNLDKNQAELLSVPNFALSAASEVVYNIDNIILSKISDIVPTCVWSKSLPLNASKHDHYMTFSDELLAQATDVYFKTNRYMPNVLLVAASITPVLYFLDGFERAPMTRVAGAYKAGTLQLNKNSVLDVYVIPQFKTGEYALITSPADKLVFPYALNYELVEDTSDGLKVTCNYRLKDIASNLIVKGKVI